MADTETEFISPPEAPIFEPTHEEFKDPLAYLAKIRPIAEKAGICKIRPPSDWQPPFAVDVENFKFTPRVQRLNELEAKTRIKLNFLDQLAKFWDLQGTHLRIPNVERKILDLYHLHKIVKEEGGFDMVCRERKWSKVASRLGYPAGKCVGSVLKTHYERVLYPFDLFKLGATVDPEKFRRMQNQDKQLDSLACEKDSDYKPHGIADREDVFKRRSKRERTVKEDPKIDYNANPELRKLQFFGAGPKAAVPESMDEDEEEEAKKKAKIKQRKTRGKRVHYIDAYMCHTCGRGDGEEAMLLCDGCDDAFHTYCLIPPMTEVPKGDWRCPKCIAKEYSKPKEAYGFAQARNEYTLQSFGEMADQFKMDYFNMPAHMVPCSTVEREFWRLVNCIEEDVCVEYGADVHAMEMGSGFPTDSTRSQFSRADQEYIKSQWNLNNLPVHPQSILRHINADISGMKIPWCYVGMCFSSFAWHNEDHWSYSINYMHWGEPKTWYGVPGPKAELLEDVMKKNAPELFEQSPDLLHQLTTIMNPNTLMAYGVPIVRTDQHAGEFIVTFPRAYHAGFNQGYNFAEAVNFCPADWLPIGRECVEHYRSLHRQCVFSHEELICKMAADPNKLDVELAAATHQDMLAMVEEEKKTRRQLLEEGTMDAEREAFELLPDDERQCVYCNTTCFLSAVTCACTPNRLVCVYHSDKLCSCPASSHCLRYRYTLDELPAMLHKLKVRAESYDNWAYKVRTALESDDDDKLDLLDLKELIQEADEKKFPDSPLLQTLTSAVSEAEKCANVANQLVSKKVRTRNRQSGESRYTAKLSLEELQCFHEQVAHLPCIIKEAKLIEELLKKVTTFQTDALEALDEETPDSVKLEKLIDLGITLDVDLPEIHKLKQVLKQARWLDEVRNTLMEPANVSLETMRKMIDCGVGLAPHPACERMMAELQELLTISERWEEKARICLSARPRHVISTLEAIIQEAKGIPAHLPNITALRDNVRRAKDWIARYDNVQCSEHYPYLDILENLVNKGRPISVRLDQLPTVESQVAAAKSWRERTGRTFLKKNSTYTLLEVLSPRTDIGLVASGKIRKRKIRDAVEKDSNSNSSDSSKAVEEHKDPAFMVAMFKGQELKEAEAMKDLRGKNSSKGSNTIEGEEAKYCICRKEASGFMLQCELCRDWFHSNCVPLPKSANLKGKSSTTAMMAAARDLKFLCPLCLRSRRPRLETILSLLVSLQKLPVRMPEGEALQCLTERAMAWQDRARQALATDELASALNKLSMLSQKMVEQAAREKTERIINAEILKAANNPELSSPAGDSGDLSPNPGSHDTGEKPLVSSETSEKTSRADMSSPTSGVLEHTYSTASKPGGGESVSSPRKQSLKPTSLKSDSPTLELSDAAKQQMEELMMQGDLLEVTLDETQHIWRILQACQVSATQRLHQFQDLESSIFMESSERLERKKEKKKKRKLLKEGDGILEIMGEKIKKKKMKEKLEKEGGIQKRKYKIKDPEMKRKDKEEKKRIRKEKINRDRKEKSKISNGEVLVMDNDEDDDDCSADRCLKPTGEEVNWVQCDTCENWFHLLCVGLKDNDVKENEDYKCTTCNGGQAIVKRPRPASNKSRISSVPPKKAKLSSKPGKTVVKKVTQLELSDLSDEKQDELETTQEAMICSADSLSEEEEDDILVDDSVKASGPSSEVTEPQTVRDELNVDSNTVLLTTDTESIKDELEKTQPVKVEKENPEPVKAELEKTESVKAESQHTEPVKEEQRESESTKAEPNESKSAEAEPDESKSVEAAEPDTSKSVEAEPEKSEPVKAEPEKSEPVEAEQEKTEDVKVESEMTNTKDTEEKAMDTSEN